MPQVSRVPCAQPMLKGLKVAAFFVLSGLDTYYTISVSKLNNSDHQLYYKKKIKNVSSNRSKPKTIICLFFYLRYDYCIASPYGHFTYPEQRADLVLRGAQFLNPRVNLGAHSTLPYRIALKYSLRQTHWFVHLAY